ncbi:unnamed protein product [Absidia cylindrospora]
MTYESDLRHIKYVWVDAICVDQRPGKRKSTIYQMSNIYERATYILAVPDLHKAYLTNISIKNYDIMMDSSEYGQDIYYLINGNSDQLAAIEEEFLKKVNVPTDPILRQLLKKYTDYFTDGFIKYKEHQHDYCSVQTFLHICETTGHPTANHQTQTTENDDKNYTIEDLHHCHETSCPLTLCDIDGPKSNVRKGELMKSYWMRHVITKNSCIRQSIEFLTDLIKDWSSRVWVISEFNIAKKKNNLKFWFTQLFVLHQNLKGEFTFFKFDFSGNLSLPSVIDNKDIYSIDNIHLTRKYSSNPVYIEFHSMMIRQLKKQTFLEMMLKSKASKNADRFHAILPQSEYQNILTNKNKVDQWNISTLTSIKLKLYEFMNTKDKLNLLFWSGHERSINKGMVLPTFATSTLSWDAPTDYMEFDSVDSPYNFDLNDPSTITLHHYDINNQKSKESDDEDEDDLHDLYCLRLKPMEYDVLLLDVTNGKWTYSYEETIYKETRKQFDRLMLDYINPNNNVSATTTTIIDVVCLKVNAKEVSKLNNNISHAIYLVGSFTENKWSLMSMEMIYISHYGTWRHCYSSENKNDVLIFINWDLTIHYLHKKLYSVLSLRHTMNLGYILWASLLHHLFAHT